MSEAESIARAKTLNTTETLTDDLRTIGLDPGDTVLVHTSMRSMGWVNGGALAVIQALMAVLGPRGTLIMPTHSADLSDPAEWRDPPVPMDWHEAIRATMPAYDPARTPTRDMGRIAELFRTWPDVMRSAHPAHSMAALGPYAAHILGRHPFDDPFGEASPLRQLYDLNARVLLIGTGYDTCTILHLAERRALRGMPAELAAAPMMVDNERRWVTYLMPAANSDSFLGMQILLDGLPSTSRGKIAQADARILSTKDSVDVATAWLAKQDNDSSSQRNYVDSEQQKV